MKAEPTIPPEVPCPACKSLDRELIGGAAIYPSRPDLFEKKFWRCGACYKSYVGCHSDTEVPLGTLADAVTRMERITAHSAFDPLWKKESGGTMKRRQAYEWLASKLGIEVSACHISWFDADTCRTVTRLCYAHRGILSPLTEA